MVKFKKIIVLTSSPFNERDYKRFGIETFQKNDFEVEVWDLTPFLNVDRNLKCQPSDRIQAAWIRLFMNKRDTAFAISDLPEGSIVLAMIAYSYDTYAIYRALSKKNILYFTWAFSYPSVFFDRNKIDLLSKMRRASFKKLAHFFFPRLPFALLGIHPLAALLVLGGKVVYSHLPVNNKTHLIWSHTPDYEVYLEESKAPARAEEHTGVFLDACLPLHPDLAASDRIPAEKYFPLLHKFFDLIERETGTRIIIAAHPRSPFENYSDFFGGRTVVRGQTASLVKNADFVISHDSCSISYAVLFKRPVIFITTNDLLKKTEGTQINFMASLLGKRAINLDNDYSSINLDKELEVNENAYIQYKNDYIKKDGSEDLPLWQSFSQYIRGLK